MCHKVGMGKPVGLGSAKIEVAQWRQHDVQMRYENLGEGTKVIRADAANGRNRTLDELLLRILRAMD